MELRALQLQPSSSWKSALDKSNRYSVEEQLCQNALSLQSEDVFELFPPVRHSMGAEILEICIEARAKFTFIGLISFPKLKCLQFNFKSLLSLASLIKSVFNLMSSYVNKQLRAFMYAHSHMRASTHTHSHTQEYKFCGLKLIHFASVYLTWH